jgi:hypothetical protein
MQKEAPCVKWCVTTWTAAREVTTWTAAREVTTNLPVDLENRLEAPWQPWLPEPGGTAACCSSQAAAACDPTVIKGRGRQSRRVRLIAGSGPRKNIDLHPAMQYTTLLASGIITSLLILTDQPLPQLCIVDVYRGQSVSLRPVISFSHLLRHQERHLSKKRGTDYSLFFICWEPLIWKKSGGNKRREEGEGVKTLLVQKHLQQCGRQRPPLSSSGCFMLQVEAIAQISQMRS